MREDTDVEVYNVPSIRTRMAEDLVPPDKKYAWYQSMGIIPGSDEVAALEFAAGQERRNNLRPILPSLDLFTRVASGLIQAAILLQEDKAVDDESFIAVGSLTMANIAVTRSVIAQMLDLGILKISGFTVEGTTE